MSDALRYARRLDPDAPLLVLFHDDGGDASNGIAIGRRLWRGAPLASLQGRSAHGSGWRHLSESAAQPADLGVEAGAIDRLAETVAAAAKREPQLVEVVGMGVGGGADALLALLCRHPALFAGAVLCRPSRHWSRGSLEEIETGAGVEVLIVAEAAILEIALVAKLMLSLSGHRADIRLASRNDEIEIGRAWLCRELRGESGDDG